MNTTTSTIRCWVSRRGLITVAVVVAAGGATRGYAVEARTWWGTVVCAVVVSPQGLALRIARRLARLDRDPSLIAGLQLCAPAAQLERAA